MPRNGPFLSENAWLDGIELHLEGKGLLKRNPARAAAAVKNSKRGFLKAEKQLWKMLGMIVPYGAAQKLTYHPGRGFIFNWSKITEFVRG